MDLIKTDYDITRLTTFGIPVKARLFAEYSNVKELEQIMRTPEYQQSEVLHIGGGSNLLFVKDFDGLVLHSAIKGMKIYRKDADTAYVIAGAGERWIDLVDFCVNEGLAGLENLAYIPGEVGASAIQNVGAYGVEAADCIHTVECYDRLSHKIVNFRCDECRYAYRDSFFKHEGKGRYYVMRVSYRLTPSDKAKSLQYGPLKTLTQRLGHNPTIAEVRDEVTAIRRTKLPEPAEAGSAGSFFTNPIIHRQYYEEVVLHRNSEVPHYDLDDPNYVKIPAGWLVEHAGLKGMREGGAVVLPQQCLVIANIDGATGSDVCQLSKKIINIVSETFGIRLHPEVNFIDNSIDIRVLGSGTSKGVPEPTCSCDVCRSADPHDKRLRASVMVNTHSLNLLIDVSPDFRTQALRNDICDIDAVLLTHSHYDHVGGIDDLRPYCTYTDLPIYLRPDVADDLRRRLDYCFRTHPYPGVPVFSLHEITDTPFYINDLKIIPISVNHARLPIVGYRIDRFAYITDAKTISEVEADKLRGVDTLIVNALRFTTHFSHFSVEEALRLIGEINPRRAYLTHMCHEIGLHADVEQQLKQLSAELCPQTEVHLAYDGLHLCV